MIKQKEKIEEKNVPAEPKKRVKKSVQPKAKTSEAPEEAVHETTEPAPVLEFSDEEADAKNKKPDRYFEGVGRRKTAVARVRLFTKAGDFQVNNKLYTEFFKTFDQQKIVEEALQKMKLFGRFRVSVKLTGGGSHGQAEAVRHGLARCLIKFNPDFRKRLKRAGFLKRDPRAKERKKFGLKKARRAPQWAKR